MVDINKSKSARFRGLRILSSSLLIKPMTLFSHSTAEISAKANRKKPRMLKENRPLYLNVYLRSLV